ncbi:MAG: hypothetical protein PHS62_00260 [Patescibacteria group bacterium]|nr:hypothetical protein [Patescibacteria group bacterium]
MDEENKTNETEQIKKLLEQNLEYSQEIYRLTKSIKRYITLQKIISVIYLLLIVVPLILGLIYLPPLLKTYMGQYQELLGGSSVQDLLKGSAGNLNLNNVDVNNLPDNIKALIK